MIAVSYDALTGVAVIMVGAGVGVIGSIVTYLGPSGSHIGHKESIKDTARVLGRVYDAIEYRSFSQDVVDMLAKWSGVPVCSGLTDQFHPTQIQADLLTMREHCEKPLRQIAFCFLGDAGNNMGDSLLIGAAKRLAEQRGWSIAPDGDAWRRVVAPPKPARILEIDVIRLLVEQGVIVICAGGGGIPVAQRDDGAYVGVEAVFTGWSTPQQAALGVAQGRHTRGATEVELDLGGLASQMERPLGRMLWRAEIAHARYLDDAERLDPPLSEHISQAKSLVY